jgi:phosphate-selective porin
MCLDRITSSRCITFIERASIEALAPQRNTGIEFTFDQPGVTAGAIREQAKSK